ncbi:MAG: heparinase II/III family protein [Parvularculaceae bacterium]
MSANSDQRGGQARAIARDMVARVQRVWGESPFYQARLKGPAPDRLYFQPVDPRMPDLAFATSFAKGKVAVGEESIDCEGELERIWDLAEPDSALFSYLHEFSWLKDLAALGDAAKTPARKLLRAWLERYENWSPEAWEPYATAERLVQLCCHGPFMLQGGDALWRSRVLSSMARQTRHLERAAHRAGGGFERLMTAMALCVAGLCLPGCETSAERGQELLRRELRLQIRPDGGHVSRNPSRQLAISVRLLMVLKAFESRRIQTPGYLRHVAGRAAAMAHFFRCGDGRLAVFNGGYEDDGRAVLAAFEAVEGDGMPTGFARHSGYQRLAAARALVILDVGGGAHAALSKRFDSVGAFHFSSGRSRIVVNCGSGAHLGGDWARALARAAAHSTLSFDGFRPAAPDNGVAPAAHRRAEDGRGLLVEIDRRLGGNGDADAQHIRRLFLLARGDDLRGEDRLVGLAEAAGRWRLRFHLHPSVRASLARDGKTVILALPNREGWRFRTNCADISLQRSIYCGEGGAPQAAEQIVLSGDGLEPGSHEDIVVRWAFRRLEGV